jgi:hypothetical protein
VEGVYKEKLMCGYWLELSKQFLIAPNQNIRKIEF